MHQVCHPFLLSNTCLSCSTYLSMTPALGKQSRPDCNRVLGQFGLSDENLSQNKNKTVSRQNWNHYFSCCWKDWPHFLCFHTFPSLWSFQTRFWSVGAMKQSSVDNSRKPQVHMPNWPPWEWEGFPLDHHMLCRRAQLSEHRCSLPTKSRLPPVKCSPSLYVAWAGLKLRGILLPSDSRVLGL